ncbi:MAG: rRNA maturation RNase YbeY [Clostridia bacterium]
MLNINKRLKPELIQGIHKAYEYTLEYLHQPIDQIAVNLHFLPDSKIRKLNRDHRGIDKTTDVLSFPMTDTAAGDVLNIADYQYEVDIHTGALLLGEIFISPKVARRQAKEYGHSLLREICFLFCHGMLHILGYDHIQDEDRKVMEKLQAEIMNACEITRGE